MFGVYLAYQNEFDYDNCQETFPENDQWREIVQVDNELLAQLYVTSLNGYLAKEHRNKTTISVLRAIFKESV